MKVYAQAGSKDLVQATAALQPRIINSGTLDVIGTNSRAAGCTVGANTQRMATASFTSVTSSSLTMAAVVSLPDTVSWRLVGGCSTGGNDSGAGGWLPAYIATSLKSYDGTDRASLSISAVPFAYSSRTNASSHRLRKVGSVNTSSFTTGAKAVNNWLLWCYNPTSPLTGAGGKFSECVIWSSDRDSDMTSVLTEQTSFYGL